MLCLGILDDVARSWSSKNSYDCGVSKCDGIILLLAVQERNAVEATCLLNNNALDSRLYSMYCTTALHICTVCQTSSSIQFPASNSRRILNIRRPTIVVEAFSSPQQ